MKSHGVRYGETRPPPTTNLPRGQAWLRELHENGQEIHNAKDARDAKGAQTPYGDQAEKQETQELRKKSGNPSLRITRIARIGIGKGGAPGRVQGQDWLRHGHTRSACVGANQS